MDVLCPKCGRVFHNQYDHRGHLCPINGRSAVYPRKKTTPEYSEMTPGDWLAIAGWLDPKNNFLKGQVGSE